MIWLAIHMWALLAGSFVIGILVGWWIWRSKPTVRRSGERAPQIGSLEDDAPRETQPGE